MAASSLGSHTVWKHIPDDKDQRLHQGACSRPLPEASRREKNDADVLLYLVPAGRGRLGKGRRAMLTQTRQAPLPPGRIPAGRLNLHQRLNAKCLMFSDSPPHWCRQSLARPSLGSSCSLVSCSCMYFSSWLSSPSSSRPGYAGRSGSFLEPLKGQWAGLLQASKHQGLLAAE